MQSINVSAGSASVLRPTSAATISDSAVDYKVAGDSRSALTAADLVAQCAVVEGLERAWPGLRIVGEEDLACSVDSDAAMGGVCASDLAWSIAAAEPAGLRRDLLSALLEESAPEAAPVDTCQTAARSLLEEHVPRPSRLHALVLETGATAFVPLPDT